MNREERQIRITNWVIEAFGERCMAPKERAARLLEEAVELAQSEGLTIPEVRALIEHIYSKPCGTASQEVGNIAVTLLAYCGATGFSADEEEEREVLRVLGEPLDYFRLRHQRKARAGIAMNGYTPGHDTLQEGEEGAATEEPVVNGKSMSISDKPSGIEG